MLIVRLAGDHLYGKLLFTWLSLVMSMMVSFVLFFFPRGVLGEILNLIESVSGGFPSYFYRKERTSVIISISTSFVETKWIYVKVSGNSLGRSKSESLCTATRPN